MDLAAYAGILWRRAVQVVIVSIVVAGAVYGVASRGASRYQAHALLSLSVTRSGAGDAVTADSALLLAKSYVDLATTPQTLSEAAKAVGIDESANALQHDVGVSAASDSSLVTVKAIQGTAARATALAQAVAEAVVDGDAKQQAAQLSTLNAEIASTVSQISASPSSSSGLSTLQARYAALVQATDNLLQQPTNGLTIVQPAGSSTCTTTTPACPEPTGVDSSVLKVAPRPKRDAVVALVLALFLNCALVLLLQLQSDRFTPQGLDDEVDVVTGRPLLARIPARGDTQEAMRDLRTVLFFIGPEQWPDTIAVIGTRPGSGSSFVASRLAISIASLGRSVVLVDADLRRPSLHEVFGVGRTPGFADVLSGSCRWTDAHVGPPDEGRLAVVPAGSPADDPAGLVAMHFTKDVLGPSSADGLVVVDTSAALSCDDGLTVASQCDATILVIDCRTARRRDVQRAANLLRQSGATLVGVVANRSKADRRTRRTGQPARGRVLLRLGRDVEGSDGQEPVSDLNPEAVRG